MSLLHALPCTVKSYLIHSFLRLQSRRRGGGRLSGEQRLERSGVRHRSTASEVLADKSDHFVRSKMILCHQSNVAIVAFPKLHFF